MHSRIAKEQFKLLFMVPCWLSLSCCYFGLALFICSLQRSESQRKILYISENTASCFLIVVFKNTYAFVKQQERSD